MITTSTTFACSSSSYCDGRGDTLIQKKKATAEKSGDGVGQAMEIT
jgi:hypothetical protein